MKKLILLIGIMFLMVGCGADDKYKQQLKESKKNLEETREETKRLEGLSKQIDETTNALEELQEDMGIESDENNNDDSDEPEHTNEAEALDESKTIELLEYGALSEGDSISSLTIEGGEIKVVVDIADDDIFDDKSVLAELVYSRAGDELLEYDGWDVLTIEFIDIGTVSFHRDESETNEYDMSYFPTEKIIEQLN